MTYAGAIVDLDGTVYRGDRLVDGAAAGVDALRDAGLSLCFLSNNPTKTGDDYVRFLQDLGVDARAGEACSSGEVTTEYIALEHPGEAVLVIGSDGLAEQLLAADLPLTDDPAAADVLLASWTAEFDYDDMRVALRTVDDGTTFLGTDPDRTWPTPSGRTMPGSGAIIRAVAGVTGRDPDHVLGKPSEHAREAALERLGEDVDPAECLVVGDRLDTDLAMGEAAGMTTVLVCSGITDVADVAASDVQPDYVIDDLGAIDAVLGDG